MDTRGQLGGRIRALRCAGNISQSMFALMTGVSRSYLTRVEHGRSNITLSYLERIADGFGLTLSELFEGIGDKQET